MNTATLRAVMDVAEYNRERQRLQETYGSPDAHTAAAAKSDQAFAELFHRSGWTQQQLAEREGKTQGWVHLRLRFGRFLGYAQNNTAVLSDLTEWRFRGFWERTDKTDDENVRFAAVIRLMREPALSGKRRDTPKIDQARELVRPLVEAGGSVSLSKLTEESGLSHTTIEFAKHYERGRIEGLREAAGTAPIDTSGLSKAGQEKLAALEQRLRTRYEAMEQRLEAQFNDRVSIAVIKHTEEYLMPIYKEKLEAAEQVMKAGSPFTNRQFLSLLAAYHPDTTTSEKRNEAFILLKEKEVRLRPEERDRPFTSSLPSTLAELLARRKAKKPR